MMQTQSCLATFINSLCYVSFFPQTKLPQHTEHILYHVQLSSVANNAGHDKLLLERLVDFSSSAIFLNL